MYPVELGPGSELCLRAMDSSQFAIVHGLIPLAVKRLRSARRVDCEHSHLSMEWNKRPVFYLHVLFTIMFIKFLTEAFNYP